MEQNIVIKEFVVNEPTKVLLNSEDYKMEFHKNGKSYNGYSNIILLYLVDEDLFPGDFYFDEKGIQEVTEAIDLYRLNGYRRDNNWFKIVKSSERIGRIPIISDEEIIMYVSSFNAVNNMRPIEVQKVDTEKVNNFIKATKEHIEERHNLTKEAETSYIIVRPSYNGELKMVSKPDKSKGNAIAEARKMGDEYFVIQIFK